MFLAVTCQHVSGACQSHSCPVLSLREASQKYIELSPSTPPFLTLQFHEKDLTPTPNPLQIRPILPPLGHILSDVLDVIEGIAGETVIELMQEEKSMVQTRKCILKKESERCDILGN